MDAPVLPQQPTDARVEIDSVEWLFEPDWAGERLIARRDPAGVQLTDEAGTSVTDRDEVCRLLDAAVLAGRATVDGVWTAQPFLDETGLDTGVDGPARRAFVAIDLLELDGATLLDVPFQERRRLLDSVIQVGVQVRLSPIVRQPLAGWLEGWRGQGFTHYLARHMNARYLPGTRSDDWLRVPIASRAASPGVVGRLVGVGRTRGTRRIRD